jgi:hypothetical protein
MSSLITLECPSCGGKTRFASDSNILVCQYCGNEHALRLSHGQAAPPPADMGAAYRRSKGLAPQPKSVRVEKNRAGIKLSWRWYSPKFLGLVFFCVIWDGFLCFWYSIALNASGPGLMMMIFPLLHVAVGVGLTYYTLAGFLNTSTVILDQALLKVQHDPLPWPGEIKVPVNDIHQIYCKQQRSTSKNDTVTYTYTLSLVRKDRSMVDVLKGLDSPEIATFMEHQLESWLRIEDQPVRGEFNDGIPYA